MKKFLKLIRWPFTREKAEPANQIRENATVYEMGGGWGNAIGWSRDTIAPEGRVWGCKRRRPVIGDVLLCKMKDGRTLRFVFTSVKYCNDPHDLFFANVTAIDFVGES